MQGGLYLATINNFSFTQIPQLAGWLPNISEKYKKLLSFSKMQVFYDSRKFKISLFDS
jgi:hypothetical protein